MLGSGSAVDLAFEERGAVFVALAQTVVDDGLGARFATDLALGLAESEVVGERDFGAHRAAQQHMQRLAPGLAANVP